MTGGVRVRGGSALAVVVVAAWALPSAAAPGSLPPPVPAARSAPDTIVQVWGSTVTATSGSRATVAVRIDMTASEEALGRLRGRARFAPTLLNFQGFSPGDAEGELTVDTTRAEQGVVAFELDAGEAGGTAGRAALVELGFWVTAAPGGLAEVVLELDALEGAERGADLLGLTVVRHGTVLVR